MMMMIAGKAAAPSASSASLYSVGAPFATTLSANLRLSFIILSSHAPASASTTSGMHGYLIIGSGWHWQVAGPPHPLHSEGSVELIHKLQDYTFGVSSAAG